MYKLILVDDELEVRKAIADIVPWNELGFEIAGVAENGKEAYEMAEITIPDIVITDIRMPFMDGLELANALKKRFPTIRIVILTAYDEFDYAQQAIKLNVAEYVLKPASSKDLIDILLKVKNDIDREKAQREDVQQLIEQYKKALPVLRENFLSSLITGNIPHGQVYKRATELDLDMNGDTYAVAVIALDKISSGMSNNNRYSVTYETNVERYVEDLALPSMAVFNLCKEIAKKDAKVIPFFHNDSICLIIIHKANDKHEVLDYTFSVLEEIRLSAEKYLRFTITIGLGNISYDISAVSDSYKNALSALDYRLLQGDNRIIFIEDIECLQKNRFLFDENSERALITSIKTGSEKDAERLIEDMFTDITELKVSFKDFQIFLMEILIAIIKASKSLDVDPDAIFGANWNMFAEMQKFKDILEAKKWLKGVYLEIIKRVRLEKGNACKQLVKLAKEYLHGNFNNHDLTIEKVAKHIHISPSYFSAIFKKETKETFVNYLVNIRLTEAKSLLKNTNLKTLDIADRVGYSDPSYFSYVFKKHCGISPSTYRSNTASASRG